MPKAVRQLVNSKKLIQIIRKFKPTFKTKYKFTKKPTVIAKSRCHLECPYIDDIGIRYDTRCYFNVRLKADISRLNLLHGNDN